MTLHTYEIVATEKRSTGGLCELNIRFHRGPQLRLRGCTSAFELGTSVEILPDRTDLVVVVVEGTEEVEVDTRRIDETEDATTADPDPDHPTTDAVELCDNHEQSEEPKLKTNLIFYC